MLHNDYGRKKLLSQFIGEGEIVPQYMFWLKPTWKASLPVPVHGVLLLLCPLFLQDKSNWSLFLVLLLKILLNGKVEILGIWNMEISRNISLYKPERSEIAFDWTFFANCLANALWCAFAREISAVNVGRWSEVLISGLLAALHPKHKWEISYQKERISPIHGRDFLVILLNNMSSLCLINGHFEGKSFIKSFLILYQFVIKSKSTSSNSHMNRLIFSLIFNPAKTDLPCEIRST